MRYAMWTSLVVYWLRPCASIAGSVNSIPGGGTKILRVKWCRKKKKKCCDCFCWTSLAFQWFRLHASTAAGGMGWIPGQGTKVPPAVWLGPKNEMFFFMASSPSLEKLQARRGWRGPPSHPLLLPRVSSAHSHGVDGPKKAWSPRMKLTGHPSSLPLPTLHYFDPEAHVAVALPLSTVTGSSGPHPPTAGDSQDKGSPRSLKKLSFMQRGTWRP